tara:strand:- start:446 stop:1222 length:777 start_codon:yes stop_codon:yes gene_type:complete
MSNQHIFNNDEVYIEELRKSFSNFSNIQIRNLIPEENCKKIYSFIETNEDDIIKKYESDKRSLVLDRINGQAFIKYFDKPLDLNFSLFNIFLNSKIFNLAKFLIGEDIFLARFELHSRCEFGTQIPPHQDNAYFGLNGAKSLTFYISLNKQFHNQGGLRYYKIPIGETKKHIASDQPGFSLTVEGSRYKNHEIFNPNYEAGDCTIHHSTSIHFADEVPKNSKRVLVVRLAFHSIKDYVKPDHKKWYEMMVQNNRNKLK